MKFLKWYSDYFYVVIRIVAGGMFSLHGAQKVFGIFGSNTPQIFSQLWIGGLIELVCGIMIMVGLKSEWAAFLASGEMAVAYFQFHFKFQFGKELLPPFNNGELAVLYCFLFLYISSKGSGIFSLDKFLTKMK